MAGITRKTKRYPSDLTDEEWERIAPLMPPANRRGRKRTTDFREIINALRYLVADFFCDGVDGSQRHRDVPR